MAQCRKCGRSFDWDGGYGYAKLPNGEFLCSMNCELKEVFDENAKLKDCIKTMIKAMRDPLDREGAELAIESAEELANK